MLSDLQTGSHLLHLALAFLTLTRNGHKQLFCTVSLRVGLSVFFWLDSGFVSLAGMAQNACWAFSWPCVRQHTVSVCPLPGDGSLDEGGVCPASLL